MYCDISICSGSACVFQLVDISQTKLYVVSPHLIVVIMFVIMCN